MLKVRVQLKFFCALKKEERESNMDLRTNLLLFPLFERCQETLGIRFTSAAMSRLFGQSSFSKNPLDYIDIEKIDVTTHSNF